LNYFAVAESGAVYGWPDATNDATVKATPSIVDKLQARK
jgi:glucose/arabinose dehydrogenase